LEGLRNFRGGEFEPPNLPPSIRHWLGSGGVESGKYLPKMIRFCQDDDDDDDENIIIIHVT